MGMEFFKKQQLELVRTTDQQYLIKSDTYDFVYTNEKEGADYLLNLLLEVDWNKYKTLQNYRNIEPVKYEKLAVEIRKYAVPKKVNGNYLSSLNGEVVRYRLQENTMVSGYHLENGLAYRPMENGGVCLDVVYSGIPWMAFNDELHIKEFIKITKSDFNYCKENIVQKIMNNYHYNEFSKSAYAHAANSSNSIKRIPIEVKASFDYDLYINDGNAEKRNAYIEAMKELNSLHGMKKVKDKFNQALVNREAEMALKRVKVETDFGMHTLFVGSAGTGKTRLARIMAKLYWSMGYIKENKLIEISREGLVSKYTGETEEKTESVIQSAMGGMLFVDEAYTLISKSGSGPDYGKTALEIIMRYMENEKTNLVVVFAGYEKEIEELLSVNEGLPSRFNDRVELENYTTNELVEIAKGMIEKQGFDTKEITNELKALFDRKSDNGYLSGNARSARKFVEKIINNHKEDITTNNGSLLKISPASVKKLYFSPTLAENDKMKELLEIGLTKLNGMVGLNKLKKKIKSWTNYLRIEMKRSQLTGETNKIRLHMTFEGPPGTGKTTVARLMGTILKGVGAVENGHVVEVLGKDLVAGYQGQTAGKVQEIFKKAKGGILFIDEVYSMVQSENDTFGLEALATLIALMENNSDDVVVIFAGYSDEVQALLNRNPGTESRIAERFLFEDYSEDELVELFEHTLANNKFKIKQNALNKFREYVEFEYASAGNIKGNGRWVRNMFEKIKVEQADRLENEDNLTVEKLFTIEEEDINLAIKYKSA